MATRVSVYGAERGPEDMFSVTDPALNAAVTASIISEYTGVLITTTTTGNAQTMEPPVDPAVIIQFVVSNNDTSTHSITVEGLVLAPGDSQLFIWDGTVWGPSGSVYATTSSDGVIRLASSAEAVAGNDPLKAITPSTLTSRLAAPGTIGKTTPAEGWLSPSVAKGPAIITTFAGTVTAAASTTVTFSSAADAILAGYSATNPILGATLISNALTRHIVSWTNPTTCVVDSSVTWAGTAITSVQYPIATFVNSAGVVQGWMNAEGNVYFVGKLGVGDKSLANTLDIASAPRTGTHGTSQSAYITGTMGAGDSATPGASGNIEFRHTNGTVGIGFGFQGIYSLGDAANAPLTIQSKGDQYVAINSTAYSTGNIGLFTSTFGTSAAKVLAIGEGTAPSDSPANATQIWSADKGGVALKNALHMRDEGNNTGPVAFANKLIVTHSGSEAITTDQMYGTEHILTGVGTLTLPALALGMNAVFTATTAAVMTLDSNGADQFILGGTALTAGYSIDSDGSAYATCEVVCLQANKGIVRNTNVVFVDGGAS